LDSEQVGSVGKPKKYRVPEKGIEKGVLDGRESTAIQFKRGGN